MLRGYREGGDGMWRNVVKWCGDRRRESKIIWTVGFITIASLTPVRGSIVYKFIIYM